MTCLQRIGGPITRSWFPVIAVVACVGVTTDLGQLHPAAAQVGYGKPTWADSLAEQTTVRLDGGGIAPGTVETGLAGEFSSVGFGDSDRFESFVLSTIVGRFITRSHELGARFDIAASEHATGSASVLGFSSLHLPVRSAAIPFATFAAGGVLASAGHFQLSFGGGYKAFMTDAAAIRVEYRYDLRFFEEANLDTHRILFGLSAFVGPSSN